jgi:hypothetical protein
VAEDTSTQVWRVQFMAFLSRPPNANGVNVIFYHVQGGRRRYVFSEQVALSDPASRVFFHQAVLHRSPDEFQPMENYEVAISVSDARGQQEIARGRIGLTGPGRAPHRRGGLHRRRAGRPLTWTG